MLRQGVTQVKNREGVELLRGWRKGLRQEEFGRRTEASESEEEVK